MAKAKTTKRSTKKAAPARTTAKAAVKSDPAPPPVTISVADVAPVRPVERASQP